MKHLFSIRIVLLGILLSLCSSKVAAQKRPNIILVLADDMGFSDLGSYGGEIKTPNLDQLAAGGIRYRQFYNGARCCPTRASLMTGLYPHQAGMGWMAAADLGTPAYQGNLNNESVTIAEVLKTAGYHTYMTGKWHLTNERKIDGMIQDNWPIQRGFDRYFGIIPGGANYFTPVLYSNNHQYKAPENFYLTDAITDTTVQFIEDYFKTADNNPFFMYVAYTAPHWPLHAPKEVIDSYKKMYQQGWDVIRTARFERQKKIGLFPAHTQLSPRDAEVGNWSDLSPAEQEEMGMRMAIYAAQTDIMDRGIGKIVQTLQQHQALENTLILFLSDNGACAEYISSGKSKAVDGTVETFESYRLPWANVSSTPYREYKHFTQEGGIATPLIVHWPQGIQDRLKNGFIAEYGHITDIMATCVEVAGAKYPQRFQNFSIVPQQGKSLLPHFEGRSNNRGKIFWEHEANIALRNGKWKLVAKTLEDQTFSKDSLKLFDMDADPTEMNDVSKAQPQLVQRMFQEWDQWAHKIGVYPMDTREYNQRMRGYRRVVNGTFDDHLGGWRIHAAKDMQGFIKWDSSHKLTGKNAALVSIQQSGRQPANLSMAWPFAAEEGEQFEIRVTSLANQPVPFWIRLEGVENGSVKVIDQLVQSGKGKQTHVFRSSSIPKKGNYRIGLYFGTSRSGSNIWIDDVVLNSQKNKK